MRHALAPIAVLILASSSISSGAFAQDAPPAAGEQEPESGPGELVIKDGKTTIAGVEFMVGPCKGKFGVYAEVDVPEGLLYTGRAGAVQFMALNQNPTGDSEVGLVFDPVGGWFALFSYEESGHVKDDEKDDLDADALLEAFKTGNEHSNKVRQQRGWETLELVGWHKPPFYDPKTNNLTWATTVRSKHGDTINWTTKLLGRTGTMNVDLVVGPEAIDAAMPKFDELISGYRYTDGNRYAEFRSGDKVAEYGLTALVAGGAGVLAFKTGLLATIGKFLGKIWYLLVAGIAAVFSKIKGAFGFGKKESSESSGS